jgi:hypothetical protein
MWITKNQRTIVVNFHQDFAVSMHSNFLRGQMDMIKVNRPNHSGETRQSYQGLLMGTKVPGYYIFVQLGLNEAGTIKSSSILIY